MGDRLGEAAAWDSIGFARAQLRHYRQAAACWQRAIELTEQLGARYHQARVLVHLGDTHRAVGEPHQGRRRWRQALAIMDELGHPDADDVWARLTAPGP